MMVAKVEYIICQEHRGDSDRGKERKLELVELGERTVYIQYSI